MKALNNFIQEKFEINKNTKAPIIDLYKFITKYDLKFLESEYGRECSWKKYDIGNKDLIDKISKKIFNKQDLKEEAKRLYTELTNNEHIFSEPFKTLCDRIVLAKIKLVDTHYNIIAVYYNGTEVSSLVIDLDNNSIKFELYSEIKSHDRAKYEDLLCQICDYLVKK